MDILFSKAESIAKNAYSSFVRDDAIINLEKNLEKNIAIEFRTYRDEIEKINRLLKLQTEKLDILLGKNKII